MLYRSNEKNKCLSLARFFFPFQKVHLDVISFSERTFNTPEKKKVRISARNCQTCGSKCNKIFISEQYEKKKKTVCPW